jgi:16S rRNA (guanine527-N7)-methyltransferase
MTLAANLHAGVAALDITLPAGAEEKLLAYLALLAKWNRTYNLTSVRREEDMLTHHVLDSLAVLPAIEKSALAIRQDLTLADVGSGAGLPGLLLALARPDWQVASIEASQKKAAFQQQVKIELGLTNVSIHCARVEAVKEVFAAAISRAFASLADFVRHAGHLSNTLLAMKGVFPADEVATLPAGWKLSASHELHVPGLFARRHLLVLEKY